MRLFRVFVYQINIWILNWLKIKNKNMMNKKMKHCLYWTQHSFNTSLFVQFRFVLGTFLCERLVRTSFSFDSVAKRVKMKNIHCQINKWILELITKSLMRLYFLIALFASMKDPSGHTPFTSHLSPKTK
jgi:hypothetical protein